MNFIEPGQGILQKMRLFSTRHAKGLAGSAVFIITELLISWLSYQQKTSSEVCPGPPFQSACKLAPRFRVFPNPVRQLERGARFTRHVLSAKLMDWFSIRNGFWRLLNKLPEYIAKFHRKWLIKSKVRSKIWFLQSVIAGFARQSSCIKSKQSRRDDVTQVCDTSRHATKVLVTYCQVKVIRGHEVKKVKM